MASHVAAAAGKANTRVYIMSRNFTYLNRETVHALYTALVRPLLNYGTVLDNPI